MEVIYFLVGLCLAAAFAIAALHFFTEGKSLVGILLGAAAVASLFGGIFASNQVFVNDCEAAGGYMLGDSCYGFSDPEFEIDDD